MRMLLFVSVVALPCVLQLGLVAPVAAQTLPSPVAHWRFDGDAKERISGVQGHLVGGASVVSLGALEGGALELTDVNGWLDLPDPPPIDLGDSCSIAYWVRAASYPPDYAAAFTADNLHINIGSDGRPEVAGAQWQAPTYRMTGAVPTDSTWHHVAFTYNSTTDQLITYLDGVPEAAIAANPLGRCGPLSGRISIGAWATGEAQVSVSGFSFNGDVPARVARFGPTPANLPGNTLALVNDGSAQPTLGCNNLVGDLSGKIALIDRGGCDYDQKVLKAQQAGAVAVIVANDVDDALVAMTPNALAAQVTIPSVFVGLGSGTTMKTQLGLGAVGVTLTPSAQRFHNGLLDDLRFYNKALTATEVRTVRNAPPGFFHCPNRLNAVANCGFESDLAGYSPTTPPAVRSTAASRSGAASVRVPSQFNAQLNNHQFQLGAGCMPVLPGEPYRIGAFFKAVDAPVGNCAVSYAIRGGTNCGAPNLGGGIFGVPGGTVASEWRRAGTEMVMPPGAAGITLTVQCTAIPQAFEVFVDDVHVMLSSFGNGFEGGPAD